MNDAKIRIAKKTLSFKVEGTFQSLYAAENWLTKNGYFYGSLCGHLPVAVAKEVYDFPQKWKNFNRTEKSLVDGVILSTDFREGEVTIILYN